jgi:hypothetical protein
MFVRSFSERQPLLKGSRMPHGAHMPGDFGPLQAPTTPRRNPRQAPSPDPL